MMEDDDDESLSTDFLRTEMGIMLADGDIRFQDPARFVQKMLEARFGTRYDLDRINDEFEVLWIENEVKEDMENYKGGMTKYLYTAMIPEDFDF